MVTRRTAIGAGLALASVAWAAGFDAYGATAPRPRGARSIDALLIDDSIEAPRQMARLIDASRREIPVVAIQLDAAGQAVMTRVLDESRAVAGISSGATLFCLERIAWDHGFRLTERSQRFASDLSGDADRQDMAAFLSGMQLPAGSPSPLARDYRPSRADGVLHAWTMQKSGPQFRQGRREV
jgi:hypothetical protein